jgi:hypothetical protein
MTSYTEAEEAARRIVDLEKKSSGAGWGDYGIAFEAALKVHGADVATALLSSTARLEEARRLILRMQHAVFELLDPEVDAAIAAFLATKEKPHA